MLRRILLLAILLLPIPASAQYVPPDGFHSYYDGSYTHWDGLATTLNTAPVNVGFIGSVTPGDVVGFDYGFTYLGTRYNRSFRHTFAVGETVQNAALDIRAQFVADPVVNAALGADIVSYAFVRQPSPTSWYFQFFQNWNIVTTGSIAFTPVWSAGSTMTVGIAGGGGALEVNPYLAFGRTTRPQGREPQPGDNIFGMYITGDATGQTLDLRNVDPLYGQLQWHIIDPTPGVASAKMSIMMDTLDLAVKHLTVNGVPAGPIGIQGAQGVPGGNIAGSIVQSPALTVCADVLQPGNNCAYTRVYKFAGLGIAGWTTIATLTPSNVSGSWSISKLKAEIVANTHGVGFGTLEAQAYISIANAAPAGNFISTPIAYGNAPQFRFIVAGNAVQVQVGSADGSHAIANGFAKIEYMLSDAEGNPVTWTIN